MKVGFLEEAEGVKSSIRLMSLCLLLFMFIFDIVFVGGQIQLGKMPVIDMNFIMINFVFLIGVFAPKYLQKLAELKMGSVGTKNGQ